MANLKINNIITSAASTGYVKSSYLPVGSIVIAAGVATYNQAIANGRCLCDGRALNTYIYRALHKVISNNYGGTAYSAGVTDQPAAVTTFNIPLLMNIPASLPSATTNVIYPVGASNPAALTSTVSGDNQHTHASSSLSISIAQNAVADSHTHTIVRGSPTYSSNSHTHQATPTANNTWANPVGSIQRTDGSLVSAGTGHTHSFNNTNTLTSGSTHTAHHHLANTTTTTSTSFANSLHTHGSITATAESTLTTEYSSLNYNDMLYYIIL